MMLNPARDILIGTSGFSYPGQPPKGWFGAFYPQRKTKGFDELKYYSQIFKTCEINQTFYRPPSAKVTKSWADKTPDDFSFSIKAWQKFTHPAKVSRKKTDEHWEPATHEDFDEFRAGISPLLEAGKLGVLLFQYPASFKWSEQNMEALEKTLRNFYDLEKVVELRHQSWSENESDTRRLLEEFRTGQALIDEPKFRDSIRQGLETTGDVFYFRAHGRNAQKWWHAKETWERYDYLYSREEIREHAETIKAAASASGVKKAHAFYNNHSRGNAPANAIMLAQELNVPLKAIPEAMVTQFPELARTEQPAVKS
jgi:uncharacterized protein YecE (DUF72 family)